MKIALIGYGKMGRMIEEIAVARGHRIVCIIDLDNQDDFDSAAFASADVAIEFTTPTAAYANYLRAFAHGVKVVSGSTGWMTCAASVPRRGTRCSGRPTSRWAWLFSARSTVTSPRS